MSRASYVTALSTYFKGKGIPPKSLLPEPILDHCQRRFLLLVLKSYSVVEPLVEKVSDECSSSAKDKGKSVRGA